MAPIPIRRAALAALIDHTLLKPEATAADVRAHLAEARELGVLAVCISPSFLPLPDDPGRPGAEGATATRPRTATVVGFPSGKHVPEVKAAEARIAVESGADEIDMVIDVGAAVRGDFAAVEAEIAGVRAAVPGPALLKVIIESAVLDDRAIVETCRAAERAGADFVKTSTGFHPAGGASVHAVALMARTVSPRLGVKASGGIRTTEAALSMIEAGATRLGLSGSRTVLEGLD